MKTLDEISFFLYCGFLPTCNKVDPFQSLLENNSAKLERNPEDIFSDETTAIEEGIQTLKSLFNDVEEGLQIIPLSGGLDSRTILAGLIAAGKKDQIITVTFGVPGSYDYEIGSFIARKFGVRYKVIDLNSIPISHNELLSIAVNGSSWTFLLDAHYNYLIPKEFGEDATYWSGFPGICFAGRIYSERESSSWEEAVREFLRFNRFDHSIDLSHPGYKPTNSLPQAPLLDRNVLSYEDQLNFIIRQQNYTQRAIIINDYKYKTPFFSPDWMDYALRLPHKYRSQSYIFKKILPNHYPEWFMLPNTSTIGGPLGISELQQNNRRIMNGLRRRLDEYPRFNFDILDKFWRYFNIYRDLNYIDYNLSLREREDFKSLVFENLQDLKKRGIIDWLNVDEIWDQHQRQVSNYGRGLLLLNALEVNLKFDELGSNETYVL